MRTAQLEQLRLAAGAGRPIDGKLALAVLRAGTGDLPDIMAAANRVRRRFFGDRLHHCSIINAKSGACGEDCAFCAQSARHATHVATYGLRSPARIRAARRIASGDPVERFGIVTSGGALGPRDLAQVIKTIKGAGQHGPAWCGSLGAITGGALRELRAAGLRRYHHNIETSEAFFPRICSTHTFAERIAMLRTIRRAGLQVCSGGILGMGETDVDRVAMALALARERVDSIPLNFLVPVPGTRLAKRPILQPLTILKIIAMFRLTNPRAEIKVAAGRLHLRDLQAMVFYAGATGIMIGDLLTIAGRPVAQDVQMLRDLGFQ